MLQTQADSIGEPPEFSPGREAERRIAVLWSLLRRAQCLFSPVSDYSFVMTLRDLYTRQRAGKVVVTLHQGGHALPPTSVERQEHAADMQARGSNTGRLLVFPLTK